MSKLNKERFNKELNSIQDENIKEYIKNVLKNDVVYTFKIMGNWDTTENISRIWKKFSQDGNGRWNNIQMVTGDDYDYLVMINGPMPNVNCDKNKIIYVEMEPYWEQKFKIDESQYFGTIIHRLSRNVCEWNISPTYSEIPKLKFNKDKVLSTVLSKKYMDIGQVKRIEFAKYLENNGVDIDVYGNGGERWRWKNDKGPLSYHNKDDGLFNYKYHFQCENNSIRNYVSEKLYDGILSECLVFYSGAPNVKEIIDERAYVVLQLESFEEDMKTIKKAIEENWWEQRLPYIREAKKKILNELNFFPRIEEIINQ